MVAATSTSTSEGTGNVTVGGKSKVHKKKRLKAKHVLDAQERAAAAKNIASTNSDGLTPISGGNLSNETKKKKRRKQKKNRHIKDPKEAHSYLVLWQQQQQQQQQQNKDKEKGQGVVNATASTATATLLWRFNKNTQSWLIRHMYDVEKIPKGTFDILILYLEALRGASRQRVYDDAVKRALRYKNYEKQKKNDDSNENSDNVSERKKGGDFDDNDNEDLDKSNGNNNILDKDGDEENDEENDEEYEAKRWKGLNDHDKRKEYKRARKVIDMLKTELQK